MGDYYAAVDIGASSGRLMLGSVENGQIQLEEVHRFYNGLYEIDGHMCWDTVKLFDEIKAGLRRFIKSSPKKICMQELVSKRQFLTLYISSWH